MPLRDTENSLIFGNLPLHSIHLLMSFFSIGINWHDYFPAGGQTVRDIGVSVKQIRNNTVRNSSPVPVLSLFCRNTVWKTQLQMVPSFGTMLYFRALQQNQEWALVLWWPLRAFNQLPSRPPCGSTPRRAKVFPVIEPNGSWTRTLHSWSCQKSVIDLEKK